ncbi:Rft-1-domain-containing protein [Auriscalpium vulgare]|uniref:Rft-1-domain-containing protein n=1 Tax=Auriscalpium vulgare TaxID=40419 RepID=A0ACB8RFE2_9AGAM|nr:Rft-1-domain-containing protein [Auriscalpium vulgare]
MQAGPAQPRSVLSASLASASSLVLLQLVSRLFTFALNQALVRLASPQVFGIAAIQFELLLSTILFLCREGVRNALLRAPARAQDPRLVTNISLLPVYFGLPAAACISALYLASRSADTAYPHFLPSVALYVLAAALELGVEPQYIRAQNELRVEVRVRAEAAAVFSKTAVTFVVLAFCPPDLALLAFALGQASYGIVVAVSFWRAYGSSVDYRLRKTVVTLHGNSQTLYFDPELLRLSLAMTGQSAVKQFLTEGDKFLVSRLSPLADQGGYAIASNYGSLVARIIFQPIEETARLYFSKTLTKKPTDDTERRASAAEGADPDPLATPAHIILTLLLLFTHFLLLLTTFAPPYLPLATAVLLPPRYLATSAPTILSAYVYYLPIMAYNGILEAFFASACTPADLAAQARMMAGASAAFVGIALAARTDAGLVYANSAGLALRAAYAWRFARRYFAPGALTVRGALPPPPVLAAFAAAAALTRWSAQAHDTLPRTLWAQRAHIAVGGGSVAVCMLSCVVFERKRFAEMLGTLRKR